MQEGIPAEKRCGYSLLPFIEEKQEIYSVVLVSGMETVGLHSFRVEFAAALNLLFQDESIIERWFSGEDVFGAAGIT